MPWAPPYAQPDELASFIGDASVGGDTAELTLAIEAASRSVDRACDRQFGLLDEAQARSYTAHYDTYRRRWEIPTDDFATVDGLTVEVVDAESNTILAGCLPSPINAVAKGTVWTSLIVPDASAVVPTDRQGGVKVTARWGWPAVPPAVKLATLIQASRLYARRHAPFGVAGNPEVGQLRLLERLDVDLAVSVRPFARIWGAA